MSTDRRRFVAWVRARHAAYESLVAEVERMEAQLVTVQHRLRQGLVTEEERTHAHASQVTPGDPRAGRPKGALNKTGKDARELAQKLVMDQAYVEKLKQRLLDGKLDGALERMLWQYAFGSPPDHPLSIMDDFMELSPYQPPGED